MAQGAQTPSNGRMGTPCPGTQNGVHRFDVAIVGGGASGLAAAVTAAQAGARCCIVERDVEAGLSILATGNGRCNISNARLQPRHFLHMDAAETLFGPHPERDISEFFDGLGLLLAEEDEGRLYPVTRRAESVRAVLLGACARLGITIMGCTELTRATPVADGWSLMLSAPAAPLAYKRGRDVRSHIRNARKALAEARRGEFTLHARCVVIAAGGHAGGVCEIFGLEHLEEEPVLCPIACELERPRTGASAGAGAIRDLDGLRVECMLTLMRDGASISFEQGEVLFRPYGISGIAALNLSRRVREGDVIELDLFPSMGGAELLAMLRRRAERLGAYSDDASWFDGMLARPLAQVVACLLHGEADPAARAAMLLHHLRLHVTGTTEHAQAQVRRGGIPLSHIDLMNCALSRAGEGAPAPGLFACGEALDMDADCGGYNLAWAWVSGMRAGTAAARGCACLR